jgi:hypothetical protein
MAKLDRLLVLDAMVNMTPLAWLKAMPVAPKAGLIRELLDRLARVRKTACRSGSSSGSTRNDDGSSFARATHPMPINSAVTLHAGGARSWWRPSSILRRG